MRSTARLSFDETRDSNSAYEIRGSAKAENAAHALVEDVLFSRKPRWLAELWTNNDPRGPKLALPPLVWQHLRELRPKGSGREEARQRLIESLLGTRVQRHTFKTPANRRSRAAKPSRYHYEHVGRAFHSARDKLLAGVVLATMNRDRGSEAIQLLLKDHVTHSPRGPADKCRWSSGPCFHISRAAGHLQEQERNRSTRVFSKALEATRYAGQVVTAIKTKDPGNRTPSEEQATGQFLLEYSLGVLQTGYDPAGSAAVAAELVETKSHRAEGNYMDFRRSMRVGELGQGMNTATRWQQELGDHNASPLDIESLRYALYYATYSADLLTPTIASAIQLGNRQTLVDTLAELAAKETGRRIAVRSDVVQTLNFHGPAYEYEIGFLKPALVLRAMQACGIDDRLTPGEKIAFANLARRASRHTGNGSTLDAARWAMQRAA